MSKELKMGPIKELQRRLDFTPDFPELRKYKSIPLFVYDDFKIGHLGNQMFVERAKYLGKGRTATNRYRMKMFEKENIPVLFEDDSQGSGFAMGEVYAIEPEVLLDIDEHVVQGICMQRITRNVFLLDQETPFRSRGNFHPSLKCYMYLGRSDYWEHMTTFPCQVYVDTQSKRRFYTWG